MGINDLAGFCFYFMINVGTLDSVS